MKPPRWFANQFGKPGFDIHVNIFQRFGKDKVTSFDFGDDLRQTIMDCRTIIVTDNTAGGQHCCMRL